MAKTYKKVSGTWQPIKKIYKRISGTWYDLKKVYKKVSGTWEIVHSGALEYTFTSSITSGSTSGILLSDYVDPASSDEFVITVNSGVVLQGKQGGTGGAGATGTCNKVTNCHGYITGNGYNGGGGGAGYPGIDFTGFSGKTINFINNSTIRGGRGGTGGHGGNAVSGYSCGGYDPYGGCGGAGGAGGAWSVNTSGVSISVTVNSGATGATGSTGAGGTNNTNVCGSSSCFIAGQKVLMADNTSKNIEDVNIGDKVIGAFGEINKVLALDRPILGNRPMYNLNKEHLTSNDHPHISADKKLYSMDLDEIQKEWDSEYKVQTNFNGKEITIKNRGLPKGRVLQMETGITLQTVNGSKKLDTIDTIEMSPETQLYNLAIDGSHTYSVDGYFVTGWPSERDFDYDKWEQKDRKLTVLDYM